MRRRLVVSFHVFLILLPTIVPALTTGVSAHRGMRRSGSIVSLLQQLCSNVSALPNEAFEDMRHAGTNENTLLNKIDAVISQVEVGAYRGAVNKLRNDLEKAVIKWVVSPWEEYLLDLIEQIIRLIEGHCHPPGDLKPPVIHGVFHYPEMPEYDDYVSVLTYVTDCKSGVANVTLNYSTDLGESVNLTMIKNNGFYESEIPPKPYNVNVTFHVYAWDKAGNVAVSPAESYVVGDFHPPLITYIEHMPALPNYNETVLVFVNATEPSDASGIGEVILSCHNGTSWHNTTMSLQEGLYVAEIPNLPYGTLVQYRVYAFDNAANWAAMDVYSYTVQDRFLPIARIDSPAYGSHVSGGLNVEVYVYDDNFSSANLTVNGTAVTSWSDAGFHTYLWDTTIVPDDVYVLELEAYDEAGNTGETECLVTVDNTAPTVEIRWPLNNSYVRGTVIVEVYAEDSNLGEMELKIGSLVHVWKEGGTQTYVWITTDNADGAYMIVLAACDKAGNTAETNVSVIVDNTAPSLSNLIRNPLEPKNGEQVNVSVQVFEEGSGIGNVTLWFRVNSSAWGFLNMNLQDGNWTCIIPAQDADTSVTFYIECYDNAGNSATTLENTYTVKTATEGDGTVSGFPLNWLLFIIAVIALLLGGTAYALKRKKKRT